MGVAHISFGRTVRCGVGVCANCVLRRRVGLTGTHQEDAALVGRRCCVKRGAASFLCFRVGPSNARTVSPPKGLTSSSKSHVLADVHEGPSWEAVPSVRKYLSLSPNMAWNEVVCRGAAVPAVRPSRSSPVVGRVSWFVTAVAVRPDLRWITAGLGAPWGLGVVRVGLCPSV